MVCKEGFFTNAVSPFNIPPQALEIGEKLPGEIRYQTIAEWQKSSMIMELITNKTLEETHELLSFELQTHSNASKKSINIRITGYDSRRLQKDSLLTVSPQALEDQAVTNGHVIRKITNLTGTLQKQVTFVTGTLTDDALSWWNAYAQPMGIEQANQTTWTELKRFLTNKYCPRTEIKKMEEELYNLSVKGNDLKPYVRRFQELTVLCPNMVPNNEKLLEAFIGGLPRSIEGNVTASKP
ncbi:reverse transcriptase domain-containing protein [Tanacetum coccineum]